MRVALYARATPTAPGREAVDPTLAELKAYAAQRGWEIGIEAGLPGAEPTTRPEAPGRTSDVE